MIIDFTDDELNIIYDALEEMRMSSDDEDILNMIENITDKIWKASKNGNS
jgi:hypothetical protein